MIALAAVGLMIGIAGLVLAFVEPVTTRFRVQIGAWTDQHAPWATANGWALTRTAVRLYGLGLLFTAPIYTVLAVGSAFRHRGWPDISFLVLALLVGELVVMVVSAGSYARFQLSRGRISVPPGLPLFATLLEALFGIGGIAVWLALDAHR